MKRFEVDVGRTTTEMATFTLDSPNDRYIYRYRTQNNYLPRTHFQMVVDVLDESLRFIWRELKTRYYERHDPTKHCFLNEVHYQAVVRLLVLSGIAEYRRGFGVNLAVPREEAQRKLDDLFRDEP